MLYIYSSSYLAGLEAKRAVEFRSLKPTRSNITIPREKYFEPKEVYYKVDSIPYPVRVCNNWNLLWMHKIMVVNMYTFNFPSSRKCQTDPYWFSPLYILHSNLIYALLNQQEVPRKNLINLQKKMFLVHFECALIIWNIEVWMSSLLFQL